MRSLLALLLVAGGCPKVDEAPPVATQPTARPAFPAEPLPILPRARPATTADCEADAETKALVPRVPQARVDLHLATCEAAAGQLEAALASTRRALMAGINTRDAGVMMVAETRQAALLERMPSITFTRPAGVTLQKVEIDGRPVRLEDLEMPTSVDVGVHRITAWGRAGDTTVAMKAELRLEERKKAIVDLVLE